MENCEAGLNNVRVLKSNQYESSTGKVTAALRERRQKHYNMENSHDFEMLCVWSF